MAINPDAIGARSETVESSWTPTDCILYALGVGAGALDPTGSELEFTTENSAGVEQRVLPTFAVVPPFKTFGGGSALDEVGTFDKAMIVHGEQGIELHRPIPTSGRVRSTATIVGVYDKGSGAVIASESVSVDAETGEPLFTNRTSVFVRGAGGFGGDRGPSRGTGTPERAPDAEVTYQTRSDQALLYRLSGDRNPLHSDPTFAKRGGFATPILHGLCTYGFTGRALLHTLCGSDPRRFRSMDGRFSQPVYPGEAITVSIWRTGDGTALFRTTNGAGQTVIDAGTCAFIE